MLRAYFDRSERRGVIVVAGYMATVENWEKFEKNWQEVLDTAGIRFFHMTDYVARQGQYKAWSDPQRTERIRRLIGVINRTVIIGAATGLLIADYDTVLSPLTEDQRRRVSPYGLCATLSAVKMMRWIRQQGSSQPLYCVFESGDEGAWQITEAFTNAKKKNPEFDKHLLGWSFEDKRNLWGLQAADILAYETARHVPQNLGTDQSPFRRSLMRLITRTEHLGEFLTADVLRKNLLVHFPHDETS